MDEPSDGRLLEAWTRGDATAYRGLVERHQAPLLHHARALLYDSDAADDAVQEALLRLANKPPSLDESVRGQPDLERAQLRSWLHRVTRNICMDTMRSEARRKRREENAAAPEATAGGIDAVEAGDTKAAVERGLERLPEPQREVLVLRLLGERSYREIAEITGKKVGTIGWLISEGLTALSGELSHLMPGAAGAANAPRR